MAITSYAQLQTYLNTLLKGIVSQSTGSNELDDTTNGSPHGAFWNTLTYDQFVNGSVPNVSDPNTGKPMPILVRGNSAASNFIMALRGQAGTPFDPNTGAFGQMPGDGPPFLTEAQIKPIADWIDEGCPQ